MTKKDNTIERILKCPTLKDMSAEEIIQNFEGFIELLSKKLNCTTDEILYIICRSMGILKYPTDFLEKNIIDLLKFGFDKAAIKTMAKDNPFVLSIDIEGFRSAFNNFEVFGITKKEFLKMAKDYWQIIKYSLTELLDKRSEFMSLKFDEEDFKTMIVNRASMLTIPIARVQKCMDNLSSYEYCEKEIIAIIVGFPRIVTENMETVRKKLDAVCEIGIRHCIVDNPNRLRQSAHLTRARAAYISNHYISPRSTEGINHIFNSSDRFKSAFGVDNKGVVALYELKQKLKEKSKKLRQEKNDGKA